MLAGSGGELVKSDEEHEARRASLSRRHLSLVVLILAWTSVHLELALLPCLHALTSPSSSQTRCVPPCRSSSPTTRQPTLTCHSSPQASPDALLSKLKDSYSAPTARAKHVDVPWLSTSCAPFSPPLRPAR